MLDARMRSLLFVPGNRRDRIERAGRFGADAVVIDLEDSVPPEERPAARERLGAAARACREGGQRLVIVRPGPLDEDGALDLEAGAHDADAFMIPRATPERVALAGSVVDRVGGAASLVPIFETPEGIVESLAVIDAHERVAGVFGGGIRNGDTHRFMGFEWSVDGVESLYLRSRIVLHARARGLRHIIGGATIEIDDADILHRHARSFRVLGYTGYVALHPAQIDAIHAVFSPSPDEVEEAERVVAAMAAARRAGLGSARLDGKAVSLASLRMAEDVLRAAGR